MAEVSKDSLGTRTIEAGDTADTAVRAREHGNMLGADAYVRTNDEYLMTQGTLTGGEFTGILSVGKDNGNAADDTINIEVSRGCPLSATRQNGASAQSNNTDIPLGDALKEYNRVAEMLKNNPAAKEAVDKMKQHFKSENIDSEKELLPIAAGEKPLGGCKTSQGSQRSG